MVCCGYGFTKRFWLEVEDERMFEDCILLRIFMGFQSNFQASRLGFLIMSLVLVFVGYYLHFFVCCQQMRMMKEVENEDDKKRGI